MASYYKYSASMNDRTYFTSVVTNTAGNIKRYFSNVESEIYFGSKEMEDIYQFQFSIDEKVLPIYGYNGYHASELVSGQRIIQGQFILNYTNEQEIKTTLGEIDSSVYESILADEYHPSGGSISDPIYNKLFDIMIGYGYYNVKDKQTYNATCQTIVGCKISGMQKVIDSTGQPIMEVYNFVAMDFIEENIVESEPATNNKENNKEDNNTVKEGISKFELSNLHDNVEQKNNNAKLSKNGKHVLYDLFYESDSVVLKMKEDKHNYNVTIEKAYLEIMDPIEGVNSQQLIFNSISGNTAYIYDVQLNEQLKKEKDQRIKDDDKLILNCCLEYKINVGGEIEEAKGPKSKEVKLYL